MDNEKFDKGDSGKNSSLIKHDYLNGFKLPDMPA